MIGYQTYQIMIEYSTARKIFATTGESLESPQPRKVLLRMPAYALGTGEITGNEPAER